MLVVVAAVVLLAGGTDALQLSAPRWSLTAASTPARTPCDVLMGPSAELKSLVMTIMTAPETLTFEMSMSAIESSWDAVEVPFSVGDVVSAPGENVGSAKILSAGKMLMLSKDVTLWLFGQHYTAVLQDPDGTDHKNIRAFMEGGWSAVDFPEGLALQE